MDDDACPAPGTGSQSDPFCAIQAGILAADDTDVMLVAPGTYDEAISLLGKSIHFLSTAGADATTIERHEGSVITCVNGETLDTVIGG